MTSILNCYHAIRTMLSVDTDGGSETSRQLESDCHCSSLMNKTENNHDEAKQRIETNADVQKSMSIMELVRLCLADRNEGRKRKYEYELKMERLRYTHEHEMERLRHVYPGREHKEARKPLRQLGHKSQIGLHI